MNSGLWTTSLLSSAGTEGLDGSNAIDKLPEVQLGIGIQIESPDDGLQKSGTWDDPALNDVPLKIGLVNVFVVPVVNTLEHDLERVVVSRGKLLLHDLQVFGQFQLLEDQSREESLHVIGQ